MLLPPVTTELTVKSWRLSGGKNVLLPCVFYLLMSDVKDWCYGSMTIFKKITNEKKNSKGICPWNLSLRRRQESELKSTARIREERKAWKWKARCGKVVKAMNGKKNSFPLTIFHCTSKLTASPLPQPLCLGVCNGHKGQEPLSEQPRAYWMSV